MEPTQSEMLLDSFIYVHVGVNQDKYESQLFSTHAFSASTFSLNVLPSFLLVTHNLLLIRATSLHTFSKKTNISKMTSNLIGSNQVCQSN